ncbi:hypothetical protein LZG04_15610 [Saccharothrix sp. S26]|uniref:hypothetical protein n=1 Tax=Saccharothrix sp. S26 TaxID=2907215 RepID=UPI001F29BDA2|nr:hypothetical protein [Saccharothrix sp. S26]MCE6996213.1 hypothetical protein [Saccharothrix sp. S26]
MLALVCGTLVTRPALLDSRPAAPDPFPEYLLSSRVIAQTGGHTPDPLTLRFTPDDLEGLELIFSCAIGDKHDLNDTRTLKVSLTVNGNEVEQLDCGPNEKGIGNQKMTESLRVGQQASVGMTVLGQQTGVRYDGSPEPPLEPIPDEIGLRLAVGEHVPVAEYPLPPPPKEPVMLDDYLSKEADVVLRADPKNPNLPQKVVVPWRPLSGIIMWNGSPGRLRVLIGGETIADQSNYQYAPTGITNSTGYDSVNLVPGQPVEISVEPEAAHGDWLVMLVEKD